MSDSTPTENESKTNVESDENENGGKLIPKQEEIPTEEEGKAAIKEEIKPTEPSEEDEHHNDAREQAMDPGITEDDRDMTEEGAHQIMVPQDAGVQTEAEIPRAASRVENVVPCQQAFNSSCCCCCCYSECLAAIEAEKRRKKERRKLDRLLQEASGSHTSQLNKYSPSTYAYQEPSICDQSTTTEAMPYRSERTRPADKVESLTIDGPIVEKRSLARTYEYRNGNTTVIIIEGTPDSAHATNDSV
ncbi:hypothetical protein CAPTEDRAFT_187546 [Capitella teleta]|uniref:Uncharacterized protein n=1 Tax=Capitella teleta TaxID=283909 RepID=R7UJX7_CAPTE|nr:hypothetical protein CAPTEDRAFT_187546 [Capitella teleta]|eukprot:ELU04093.1 hypothetical protein CAPTEDRAFT_187546 [Capitella teleta]